MSQLSEQHFLPEAKEKLAQRNPITNKQASKKVTTTTTKKKQQQKTLQKQKLKLNKHTCTM